MTNAPAGSDLELTRHSSTRFHRSKNQATRHIRVAWLLASVHVRAVTSVARLWLEHNRAEQVRYA